MKSLWFYLSFPWFIMRLSIFPCVCWPRGFPGMWGASLSHWLHQSGFQKETDGTHPGPFEEMLIKGSFANVWTRSQASGSVVKTYTVMPKAVKGGITQSRNGILWGGHSRPQEAPEGKKCVCWGRGKQTLFPPTPPSSPFQLMLPSLEPDPCSYPSKQQIAEGLFLCSYRPRAGWERWKIDLEG